MFDLSTWFRSIHDDVLDPVQQYWKFDAFDRKLSTSRKADFVKSCKMLQIAFSWNKLFIIDRIDYSAENMKFYSFKFCTTIDPKKEPSGKSSSSRYQKNFMDDDM